MSEHEQDEGYGGLLQSLASSDMAKVFFNELADNPRSDDQFGILHRDLTSKRAYETYRQFIAGQAPSV